MAIKITADISSELVIDAVTKDLYLSDRSRHRLIIFDEAWQFINEEFGAITLNHPLVIYQQYQPFLDYISSRQPWHYQLVLARRYEIGRAHV